MERHHYHIFFWVSMALIIGLSISAGPVVWAVIVMVSPLIVAMMYTSRGAVHTHGGVANGHFRSPDQPRIAPKP